MRKIDGVTITLLIMGPIVLFTFLGDNTSDYIAACFLYAVAVAIGKTFIDDLNLDGDK